jgi:hypothetical protein
LRQFVLYDVDEAETEVANVDIERKLWLLYRVNVLVDVLVIEFRQFLDVVELELLANGRPLRVLIGDSPRRSCDSLGMLYCVTPQRRLQMR